MTSRKIMRRKLLAACSEIGAQDGQDPRYDRADGRGRVNNRKALQLCDQIRQALGDIFASCADEFLRDLQVHSVVPAPNTAQLLVTVGKPADLEAAAVYAHLERAHGLLRSETAHAIHRRKTPDLTFCVVD